MAKGAISYPPIPAVLGVLQAGWEVKQQRLTVCIACLYYGRQMADQGDKSLPNVA